MDKHPFHLLVCDFDNCIAWVTGPVTESAPWAEKVDDLREIGRNVTCQPIPALAAAAHKHAVERFCTQHGLRLIDKPPPGLKAGNGEG